MQKWIGEVGVVVRNVCQAGVKDLRRQLDAIPPTMDTITGFAQPPNKFGGMRAPSEAQPLNAPPWAQPSIMQAWAQTPTAQAWAQPEVE